MARAVIFGCEGPVLSDTEAAFFRDSDPWGFILFARNVETPEQLARLTADLRRAVGRTAPILIDQEGGRVARLRGPHWSEWENAQEMVDALPSAEQAALAMRLRYHAIGQELRAAGIDVNCAPMLDTATAQTHPRIAERCYGRTPQAVAELGQAVAEGLFAAGVLPVLKHIPGHGRTPLDSHHDLPVVHTPLAELDQSDFAPFRALGHLKLGMVAHVVYAAIDPDRPASQSARMERMIREDLGFTGLLMSDDINMHALKGSVAERARDILAAGYDVVLHCNGDLGQMRQVAAATPALTPQGRARADAALAQRDSLMPQPIDIAEAQAQIAAAKVKEAYHA